MNKFDRVISTLVLLQTRKIIKAITISERFDVSLRTVYRDISTLKNAGIPIIGDSGIGYSLMKGYRIPPIMFNQGEAAALLTAEKFIGKLTDKETEAYYSNALIKIKAILRSSEKQSLAALDDSIVISESNSWEHKAYLQDIFKGIASKYMLKIHYQKADESKSVRKLEAIGCYHKSNKWYLIAYCHLKKDYRTFKLERIVCLEVLDEQFQEKRISLQEYINQQNDNWKDQQQFKKIKIAFNHSFIKFAESRKYYFGFTEQIEMEDSTQMTFLNGSLEIMARWLLQFGDQATVIEPIELKDRMKTLAFHLYKHYL